MFDSLLLMIWDRLAPRRDRIIAFAAQYGLPAIYQFHDYAVEAPRMCALAPRRAALARHRPAAVRRIRVPSPHRPVPTLRSGEKERQTLDAMAMESPDLRRAHQRG